jgi:hypothetical protein
MGAAAECLTKSMRALCNIGAMTFKQKLLIFFGKTTRTIVVSVTVASLALYLQSERSNKTVSYTKLHG